MSGACKATAKVVPDGAVPLPVPGHDSEPAGPDVADAYTKYQQSLVGYFRRKLPVDEDPEDMAQQAFTRLMEYGGKSEIEKPRGLLFRIARGLVTDRLRWRRAHAVAEHEPVDERHLVSVSPLQDDVLAGRQDLLSFRQKLEDLPPRCKEVFVLHRVFNMSQKQVSQHLGISISAVEKHVANAVCKLQDSMKDMS